MLFQYLEDPHAKYHSAQKMMKIIESVQSVYFEWGLRVRRAFYGHELWDALQFSMRTIFQSTLKLLSRRWYLTALFGSLLTLPSFRDPSIGNALKAMQPLAAILLGLCVVSLMLTLAIIFPAEVSDVTISCEIQPGDRLLIFGRWMLPLFPMASLNACLEHAHNVTDTLQICVLRKNENAEKVHRYTLLAASLSAGYHHVPLLQWSTPSPGIGYIKIDEFNECSCEDFCVAQTLAQEQSLSKFGLPLQGIIIDLRGNGGGSLSTALDLAALFLKKWTTLIKMSDTFFFRNIYSLNDHADTTTALLLLIDERTASAAEVLVEALCANGRAQSIGTNSFGKNTAQVK